MIPRSLRRNTLPLPRLVSFLDQWEHRSPKLKPKKIISGDAFSTVLNTNDFVAAFQNTVLSKSDVKRRRLQRSIWLLDSYDVNRSVQCRGVEAPLF